MKKRFLALAITAAMLFSLIPATAFPALAAGETVIYKRENPEYPILNAHTGSNDAFYERIKMTNVYTKYNASAQFGYGALGYGAVLVDDFGNDANSINFNFRNYEKSVIKKVASTYGNLQSNFSGTFYNRWHTHNTGLWGLGAAYDVLAFMRGGLWTGGPQNYYIGSDRKTEEEPRFGDNQYAVLPNNGKTLRLHFEKSDVKFTDSLTCECGGSRVTNMMVVFKDDRAPKIESITGVDVVNSQYPDAEITEGSRYKPGDTITIAVKYDEPIRFADDSATGKEKLGINLKIDGLATPWEAKLVKLEGDTMTFEYKIAPDYVGDALITALDFKPLTGQKDLPLVQVGKQKESFKVTAPEGANALGFSTTTSYITDLAGNAINQETPKVRASVDTIAPYVREVCFAVHPRNDDVKAMLEANGATQKPGEIDKSAIYLGLYDYLYVGLNLNERLKVPGVGAHPTPELEGVTVTTNIKGTDGKYVVLSSPYVHSHISPEGLPITRLDFKESLTVFEGMTCDDSKGRIKITAITVPATVTDLAGNAFDVTKTMPDTAGAYLDALPPVITTTQTQVNKKYTVVDEGTDGGFYFPIVIKDSTAGSGVNAVNGYFVLRNDTMFEGLTGNDRYGKDHAFQYAVTALTDTPAEKDWKSGVMGTRYPFVQVEAGNFIHIKPAAGEVYSVADCSLNVYGCDLAGNMSYEPYSGYGATCPPEQRVANFLLAWQKDSVPPTAEVGKVSRALETDGGTLTVEVALKDLISLSTTAKFLWNDGAMPVDGAAWEAVTGNISGSTATVKATKKVLNDKTFSEHLWISAADANGNAIVKNMGVFDYNLMGVKYNIGYSKGITNKPSIELQSLPTNGAIAVVVGHGNRNAALKEEQQYAVRLMPGNDALTPQEMLTQGDTIDWFLATYTIVDGKHVFAYDARTGINDLAVPEWYTGDVTVTLMATTESGATQVKDNAGSTAVKGTITIGAAGQRVDIETVKLRSATSVTKTGDPVIVTPALKKPTIAANDPNATLKQTDPSYVPGTDPKVRSTLEGLIFNIGIEKTESVPDWVMEDINYGASYVELKKVGSGDTITNTIKVYLSQGATSVTVPPPTTVPYGTGLYRATLHVKCYAGGSYETALGKDIYIDATQEKKFTVAPLSYMLKETATKDYQKYGLKDRTTTPQMCVVDNGITYLPVTDSVSKLELTMDTLDVPQKMTGDSGAYSGTYAVYAWNSSAGVDEALSRGAANFISSDATKTAYAFDIILVDTADEVVAGYANGKLPLIRDTLNIITVQVVNGNGTLSEKRTLQVFPKSSLAVLGTLSQTRHEINGGNVVSHGEVVFTPAASQNMTGVQVFASQLKDGVVSGDGAVEGIFTQEMVPSSDGSYRMPMFIKEHGSDCYTVFAQDQYGNVTKFTYTSGGTEWKFIDDVTLDNAAPVVTDDSVTVANGLYEAVFTVDDISINSMREDRKNPYMDLNLSLSFDENHTAALGLPVGTQLNLLITGLIGDDHWPHRSAPHGSPSEFTYFAWTPESGTHDTGIYDVYVEKVDRKLEVHVLGAVGYAPAVVGTLPAFALNLAVTDGFGYTGTGTANVAAQPNVKPAAVTTGTDKPAYVDNTALANDKMLKLNFTAPIKPEYSWIYPAPDKTNINWDVLERFDTVFTDAFPITDDGTWNIKFTDHFGKVWNQELTLTDVFGDYGYKIGFSTQEITKPPVMVSGVISNQNNLMTFGDFGDFLGGRLIIPSADGAANDFHATTPAKEKRYTVTEDDINQGLKSFIFILCDENYKYYDKNDNLSALKGDRLTVYLPNVVTSAPVAKPRFFFEADGAEYNESTIPGGETAGNVRVSYTTDRHVIPTDGTGDAFTFTYGGATSHTFQYMDDLGLKGSLTVDLTKLGAIGVTIAEPIAQVYEDTAAPTVNGDIYAKRLGNYTQAGSFAKSDGIAAAFDAVSYVQGYSIKINAADRSGYKIVVLKNVPSALTYAGAVSDIIDGVTIAGNLITVSKPATFTVAVVDNAAAKSTSGKDNFTTLTITDAMLSPWIDTTAPTAEMRFEKGLTLYQRMGYIKLSDDKNQSVTLDSPIMALETTGANAGWYKRMFNGNESINVLFHDAAGNSASVNFAVTDISSAAPVLTQHWSPYRIAQKVDPITHEPMVDANGNPIMEHYPDIAPSGPLNSDVTVTVSSDVPIEKVEYSTDERKTWNALNVAGVPVGLKLERVGDSVVGTFSAEEDIKLYLKITAPNGKSTETTIQLWKGAIDKTPPTFTQKITEIKRTGASAPYAVTIKLTPNESVNCSNNNALDKDGKKVVYDTTNPLTMTVTEDGDYEFRFVDLAGNATIEKVTVAKGIDRKAPKLTTTPDDLSSLGSTGGSVTVKVAMDEAGTITYRSTTLTMVANVQQEITISENGSYTIEAKDTAGNAVIKNLIVGNIDKIVPTVSFDRGTVSICQDSTKAQLTEKLASGVTVQDNIAGATYVTDGGTAVDLSTVGVYLVTYTATDTAGNKGTNSRFVRVYDKNLPIIAINGEKTDPFGTMVLKPGEHTLAVSNIKTIADGVSEPYTIKISKGIYTAGQMKNLQNNITVDAKGKFTLENRAFYTLYIITQSRYSFVTTLYVEE